MSILEQYIKENKEKAYNFAKNNAKYNAQNRPIISKDDEWIKETEWDELYNKLKRTDNKCYK